MRRYPRNVYVTAAASLLTDISTEMVIYLLPMFLAGVLKTPAPIIGLIEGTAEATASLTKLISGYISDRIGNRKLPTVLGYSLSLAAKPLLAVAGIWPLVFTARFLDRFGKGVRTAPRDALIAGSISAERRGDAFGFQRAGDTLGAFLGLAIAIGVIYWGQQQSSELTRGTFTTIVWLSLLPIALAVGILAWGLQDIKPQRAPTQQRGSLSLAAFDARFRFALLCIALFTLGNSADAFIVLLAQNRGASVITTLLMVLLFNGVYTVFAQPFGRLSDKIGRSTIILLGWGFYALVYLGLALSSAVWHIAIFWALYGLYYAMTDGALKSLVADLVPDAQRGTGYGWLNGTIGVMALPSSLIAGILWQSFGPSAPFLFGAAMAGLAVILLARIRITPQSIQS
ncbi:MAG: MFS transporter [Caldilineaceae bacterium]|nr:MFS transporter [Caldilineaceae bacterium]